MYRENFRWKTGGSDFSLCRSLLLGKISHLMRLFTSWRVEGRCRRRDPLGENNFYGGFSSSKGSRLRGIRNSFEDRAFGWLIFKSPRVKEIAKSDPQCLEEMRGKKWALAGVGAGVSRYGRKRPAMLSSCSPSFIYLSMFPIFSTIDRKENQLMSVKKQPKLFRDFACLYNKNKAAMIEGER